MSFKNSNVYAIIPARIGSTRLLRKPLVEIGGKSLIMRCVASVRSTGLFKEVVVATDSEEIKRHVQEGGYDAVLTSPLHPSGTDRVYEACKKLDLKDDDIAINVQGDQVAVDKSFLKGLIDYLITHKDIPMATLASPLQPPELENPNRVKVVISASRRALYFSRSPIPFERDKKKNIFQSKTSSTKNKGLYPQYLRHIGIYAYRVSFLEKFVSLKEGYLERIEKLEQLRAIENDYNIGVVIVDRAPLDIDTEGDLKRVRELFEGRHNTGADGKVELRKNEAGGAFLLQLQE